MQIESNFRQPDSQRKKVRFIFYYFSKGFIVNPQISLKVVGLNIMDIVFMGWDVLRRKWIASQGIIEFIIKINLNGILII